MDDLSLAYTPHPATRPRTAPLAVAGSARRASQSNGLAAMAVATMAIFSSAALLGGPRSSTPAASVASEERPFEARAVVPVRPAVEPAVVELRSESPLPFSRDSLDSPPAAPSPAVVFSPAREQHVLTSFDGERAMSDGPGISGAAPPPAARAASVRAAVVWNNPVRWISVHKQGL